MCYARLRGAPLTRVQVVPFRDALGQLADIEPRTIRFKRDDTHIYTGWHNSVPWVGSPLS